MNLQRPKGTADLLPPDSAGWQHLEATFRAVSGRFGYREIRTPAFESLELFERTSGDTSEVVTKQMYKFEDLGGRMVALKPESTAPAMRALIEAGQAAPGVVQRLCYVSSPHFRYERPQKGRLRQHHQFGVELVGVKSVLADAEVIEVFIRFLEALGITDAVVSLNSLGRAECRARYREAVLTHFGTAIEAMESEDAERAKKNPLRLLDSKAPGLQELIVSAPSIIDYLEPECAERFNGLQAELTRANVRFEVNPRIVRGLDYYTETVFEVLRGELGSQSAIGGGGRYDGLIKEIGGPDLPSVGWGMGIERLVLVLQDQGLWPGARGIDLFVVAQSDSARLKTRALARNLREQGFEVVCDLEGSSLKSQMRQADKAGARAVAVLGDDELAGGYASLKNLSTGTSENVAFDELAAALGKLRS